MSPRDASTEISLKLSDYKRSTELFLRALWGRAFLIRAAEAESGSVTSYLADGHIHVPDEIHFSKKSEQYYRAATTHAALHIVNAIQPFDVSGLNLMQRSVIGLVEDLRVELQAIDRFPGLRQLWLGFHHRQQEKSSSASALMARLSRSVLDPDYTDSHRWVQKGRQLILASNTHLHGPDKSFEIGARLANDLGQMRLPLNSGRYEQAIQYRDDNRCLWQKSKEQMYQAEAIDPIQGSAQIANKLQEDCHGTELALSIIKGQAGDGFYLEENEAPRLEYYDTTVVAIDKKLTFSEWDYRTEVLKKNWCSLRVTSSDPGNKRQVAEIFKQHEPTLRKLRHIARRLKSQKRTSVRKMLDGDELDIDQSVKAIADLRARKTPDERVFIRQEHQNSKNQAIFILLDLSESTNLMIRGRDTSVSQFMRDAVLLLGEALNSAGETFEIAGFSSNGRHEVNIINFKTFAEPFSEIQARLTSVQGGYSTRLGAAIRYGEHALSQQESCRKLLLIITDGAPSDIDVFDENYLEYDSWQAVRSLNNKGIKPFCLNLDANADSTMEHIFGCGRFASVQHLERLPELLSNIYFRYIRH